MKTGREIYFQIKMKNDELNKIIEEKTFVPIYSQRYQELSEKRDQLHDQIEKLCDKSYVDTDSVVITNQSIELDKESFKRYMNSQYGRFGE